jgi:diaminopimelate decarboxylase
VSLVESIIESYFGVAAGELSIGGVPVRGIADEHGTPLFVYDQGILDAKWSRLREALPDHVEIYYSVKANPNRAILRTFVEHGCGLEIASGGELVQALAAGCEAERIVFAGPGKSDREIHEFLEAGGGEIHVESGPEALRLVRMCDERQTNVRAAVRVNPTSDAQGGAMRMGGKPAPFGVDEERMDGVVDALTGCSRIEVSGVHIFAGTQILDADVLEAQYRKCLEIGERLATKLGRALTTVDFGGGLGIPYFDGDVELDVKRYGERIAELVRDVDPTTRLMVEPGRYLVGESGVYVTRVLDVKDSRGKRFVIVDGGMNHHLAASGNLGQVIKRNFPVAVVNKLGEAAVSKADIVGPLCTPLDVLARNVSLPEVEVSDLVGVFQSGAYARAASPLGFLSHATPPEVLVSDGKARLVRRRGSYAELMQDLV